MNAPCVHCRHALERHAAQEGMCLDCHCIGWSPEPNRLDVLATLTPEQMDAVRALVHEQVQELLALETRIANAKAALEFAEAVTG